MTITAKIIADSISPQDIRLTTLQLRYPKFIHGEFMTHRVFSRNASSSRAIPVERMLNDIRDDPAMPVFWGKNQRGMQADEELNEVDKQDAIAIWQAAAFSAYKRAKLLHERGVHKQIVNRIVEPWAHINVVVTATEWANFYALRRHSAAQPEIHALADAMYAAQEESTPRLLEPGQWHLPYVEETELNWKPGDDPIRESVARCARVSYLTQEGRMPTIDEDLDLYDRLISQVPLHASPAEHQATPDTRNDFGDAVGPWYHPEQWGNFRGWRQYRKMLANENVSDR